MKKTSKRFLLISLFIVYCSLFIFNSQVVAQVKPLPTSAVSDAESVVEIQALETVFSNILAVATALAGLAVFVMLIIGGFKWLTSGGDPKTVETAKNTLTHALVGLILMILAWIILRFIREFTDLPVLLQFKIPK